MKIFFILFLTLSLYAGHDDKKEHYFSKDFSNLELSVEQKERIKEVLKQFRVELKQFRESKESAEKSKEALFASDMFRAEELAKINQSVHQKADAIESRFLGKIHAILTPEQRKKFAHNLDEWEVE